MKQRGRIACLHFLRMSGKQSRLACRTDSSSAGLGKRSAFQNQHHGVNGVAPNVRNCTMDEPTRARQPTLACNVDRLPLPALRSATGSRLSMLPGNRRPSPGCSPETMKVLLRSISWAATGSGTAASGVSELTGARRPWRLRIPAPAICQRHRVFGVTGRGWGRDARC